MEFVKLQSSQELKISQLRRANQEELDQLALDHQMALKRQIQRQQEELHQIQLSRKLRVQNLSNFSPFPISIAPRGGGSRTTFLSVSPARTFSLGTDHRDYCSIQRNIIANFRPPPQPSISMTEFFKADDMEKRIQQSREVNAKLLKVYGKLEGISENLHSELGGNADGLARSSQAMRSLASEHHKTIAQMSVEFQQLAVQLNRGFQTTVAELDGCCRSAVDLLLSRQTPAPPAAAPPAAPVRDSKRARGEGRRGRRAYESEENDEVQILLKNWRHQEKRSHFDTARIARQFDEMKKILPDD
jgi:hypothetical protein